MRLSRGCCHLHDIWPAARMAAWLVAALLATSSSRADDLSRSSVAGPTIQLAEEATATGVAAHVDDDAQTMSLTSLLQQPAPVLPPLRMQPEVALPSPATEFARGLLGGEAQNARLSLGQLALGQQSAAATIGGDEARGRVSSDAGNLIFKSPAATPAGVQRRNPIINDPRVRGSRVGSLAASGSYWVPTRIDLDTMLSKIDSRIVDHVTVIPGPYNVFDGPNLQTIQFELLRTPRYYDGAELHGSTSADYHDNGQQVYGRQDFWGGGDAGGFRVGYGHRTGNDYLTGNGLSIPSSYNSRELNFSLGYDLSPDSDIEFTYLRLDQTNVELPGQAFDIDYLETDAYEVEYRLVDQARYDRLSAIAWYNRSRLEGSAQRPGKRRQFPFLDLIDFTGRTDVDATSTGYRVTAGWMADAGEQLTIGTDFRYVNQELNEIASAAGFFPFISGFTNANSPIPDSSWVNPGLLAQYDLPQWCAWRTSVGARADIVGTDIVDDPAKLAAVGTLPATFAQVVGTDVQDRTFGLWAAYLSTRYDYDDCWNVTFSAGRAERAPSLTELYVAQSFMFLLQNGLNTVTGDPRLKSEKLWQLDLTLAHQGDRLSGHVRGFQTWINDYITFENTGIITAPPFGQVEQVNLKYVNTDLATLSGVEMLAAYDWTDMVRPFANLQFVRGQDETRSGDFATFPVSRQGNTVLPSDRVFGRPRGFFSGVPGDAKEPLPQIIPLQSRLGVQFHEPGIMPRWTVELAARLVGPQNRVARSLLEQPTPGFGVGDFRALWRPSDDWTVTFGIENFTDRNYREHLDFRPQALGTGLGVFQPGRTTYVGVQRTY